MSLLCNAPSEWEAEQIEALAIVIVFRYREMKATLDKGQCHCMLPVSKAIIELVQEENIIFEWSTLLERSFLHNNGAFMERNDSTGEYTVSVHSMAQFMDKSACMQQKIIDESYLLRGEIRDLTDAKIRLESKVDCLTETVIALKDTIDELKTMLVSYSHLYDYYKLSIVFLMTIQIG